MASSKDMVMTSAGASCSCLGDGLGPAGDLRPRPEVAVGRAHEGHQGLLADAQVGALDLAREEAMPARADALDDAGDLGRVLERLGRITHGPAGEEPHRPALELALVDVDELAGRTHPVAGIDAAAEDHRVVRAQARDILDALELHVEAARVEARPR